MAWISIHQTASTIPASISKWDILRSAAEEVGLDADDMQSVVDGGKYTAEVAGQVQQAYQIGVSGVPTYVINDRYAIVGAQPYEAFKNALAQIAKRTLRAERSRSVGA
ncbi:DsbA family protein [Candidatus Villigracilis affinis]|uniref:DsbA family oxidoreductase n=1 Tax=Candidatus Villigracilis affinis TaxID=3140682 RepID=UPI002A230434|nr:DsbA family protein [Anaerolineales bacterium]